MFQPGAKRYQTFKAADREPGSSGSCLNCIFSKEYMTMNVTYGGERVHICHLLRSAAHERELCFMKSCKIVLKDFSFCSFVKS